MTFFFQFFCFFLNGGKGGWQSPTSISWILFFSAGKITQQVRKDTTKRSILQARLLTCAESSMLSLWDLRADKARVRESFSERVNGQRR